MIPEPELSKLVRDFVAAMDHDGGNLSVRSTVTGGIPLGAFKAYNALRLYAFNHPEWVDPVNVPLQ